MANTTITHASGAGTTELQYMAAAHHTVSLGDDVVKPTGLNTIIWAIPASDHTYVGIALTATAGTNLTIGQTCYMGADGKMELSDADQVTTMPALYMATGTIAENASGSFLRFGYMRDDSWNWGTLGGLLYADTVTAGGLTLTPPSGSGDYVQIVAQVITADILFFFPCPVMVKVA
jgi:hypothetical protein